MNDEGQHGRPGMYAEDRFLVASNLSTWFLGWPSFLRSSAPPRVSAVRPSTMRARSWPSAAFFGSTRWTFVHRHLVDYWFPFLSHAHATITTTSRLTLSSSLVQWFSPAPSCEQARAVSPKQYKLARQFPNNRWIPVSGPKAGPSHSNSDHRPQQCRTCTACINMEM